MKVLCHICFAPRGKDCPHDKNGNLQTYDEWFVERVKEAITSDKPTIPHEEVMEKMKAKIDTK